MIVVSLLTYFLWRYSNTYRHPCVRVHIFNRSIRNETTKYLGIKADYTPIAGVPLVNMLNSLSYMIGQSQMNYGCLT